MGVEDQIGVNGQIAKHKVNVAAKDLSYRKSSNTETFALIAKLDSIHIIQSMDGVEASSNGCQTLISFMVIFKKKSTFNYHQALFNKVQHQLFIDLTNNYGLKHAP